MTEIIIWILLGLVAALIFVYLATKLITFGILQGKRSFEEYEKQHLLRENRKQKET